MTRQIAFDLIVTLAFGLALASLFAVFMPSVQP